MTGTGGGPDAVRVVETHSAVVLLCGDRAYKWKKPVDLGFLDFRDLGQRADACRRELELNRRLARDVYLGLSTLTDEDGTPVEHLLVMRRLPDERRLSSLVKDGTGVEDCLREVARSVASLHARTVTPEAVDAAAVEALRRNWQDNLETLRDAGEGIVGEADVARVEQLAFQYLAGRGPLFAQRETLACDGHGDLLADDIFCLADGPRIIDCLDFADRYRMGDPLLDAAFLAMDLERLARPDLARRFLAWYAEFSGHRAPDSLAHHFVAYRAHVRAKVSVLRAGQGEAEAADRARRVHDLCLEHLLAGQVALVLVGGLPGTGKSTVAQGLAEQQGWALLSSDDLRKDLLGLERDQPAPDDAYTLAARTRIYGELLKRARALLAQGEPVVLDASWLDPAWRDAARSAAHDTSARCLAIRCDAPAEIARARLSSRQASGRGTSDATPEIGDRLAREVAPWPEAHLLDTTGTTDEVVARAAALLRGLLERDAS